jgi:hypothetical protein
MNELERIGDPVQRTLDREKRALLVIVAGTQMSVIRG